MTKDAVYRKFSAIYFLFLRGKLTYIGQTTDFVLRMWTHEHNHQHDCVRWIECPVEKLEEYEKRLIKILKPLANGQFNHGNPNRIRLRYKRPMWFRFYNKMYLYAKHLKAGKRYGRLTLEFMASDLKHAKSKFRYYYRTQGYKGTIFDTTMVHPI